jgi:hypothetical protein
MDCKRNLQSMIEMLHQQNFMAMFLTRDSSASLLDGCGGRIRID